MSRTKGITIMVDGRKLDAKIREIEGKNYKGTRISTFILRRDFSYYSKVVRTGVCNREDFATLCSYYELNQDDYILPETVEVTHTSEAKSEETATPNNDALVAILTNIYQTNKENSSIMIEMLEEMEKINKKLDSLSEVAAVVSQMEEYSHQTAECTAKQTATIGEIRSNVNILQGRVKELVAKTGNRHETK